MIKSTSSNKFLISNLWKNIDVLAVGQWKKRICYFFIFVSKDNQGNMQYPYSYFLSFRPLFILVRLRSSKPFILLSLFFFYNLFGFLAQFLSSLSTTKPCRSCSKMFLLNIFGYVRI